MERYLSVLAPCKWDLLTWLNFLVWTEIWIYCGGGHIHPSKAQDTSYILSYTQSSVKSEFNSDGLHYNVFSKPRLGSSLQDVLSFKLEEPKVIPTQLIYTISICFWGETNIFC